MGTREAATESEVNAAKVNAFNAMARFFDKLTELTDRASQLVKLQDGRVQ